MLMCTFSMDLLKLFYIQLCLCFVFIYIQMLILSEVWTSGFQPEVRADLIERVEDIWGWSYMWLFEAQSFWSKKFHIHQWSFSNCLQCKQSVARNPWTSVI